MSAQAAFYPSDPSLDPAIAPESLLMGSGFSPEFLPLSLLEKGGHQDMGIQSIQYPPNQAGPAPEVARNMSGEGDDTNRPRLRNRALRPAPPDSRKGSIDAEMNQGAPFMHSYPSVPSFSTFSFNNADHDPEFGFDNERVSPHSDVSSNKSSSPLRWQNGDTDKRAKHLERNRAAASKSRQKKKRETAQLRNRFQEVSRRRSSLEDEIKALHSQLLSLKDQILMHSRCEDEAIHIYLGRMVKQATKHDSVSSASTGEPGDEDARSHGQDSAGSMSPPQGFHSHASQIPMSMGDTRGLPCGVEKPMMHHQMFSQRPDANIFDFQMSIS
ncbi:hypothetical protein ASPVEDRAFT_86384 [Aspergillus versicolor CBS 583.65]|uniref:BZIP domain-containing protein n=1 Tax=Aspergillus versicolor CBS 583.65 TaxID=1036611 RepID=A0A1L9PU02_ASPVE|nr:uncharacterized protein ASPVEDRAFT_86384 [Aspergillus versicolor CBS 583.65]OJJ05019.1 hypothetical protein ASPVEDRAFT_86384 [Aspergillus versicolor CBS 583.65]